MRQACVTACTPSDAVCMRFARSVCRSRSILGTPILENLEIKDALSGNLDIPNVGASNGVPKLTARLNCDALLDPLVERAGFISCCEVREDAQQHVEKARTAQIKAAEGLAAVSIR